MRMPVGTGSRVASIVSASDTASTPRLRLGAERKKVVEVKIYDNNDLKI